MFKSYEEASFALHEWHTKHSKWFTGNDLPSFNIQLQSGSATGQNYFDIHQFLYSELIDVIIILRR